MYRVKIENFEGPLDLLLNLCEEQKLDICQVSLAKVADSFLEHVERLSEYDWIMVTDFLVVASKLILIKSLALLPTLELTQEEEEEITDLETQLKEYKRYKEAARILGDVMAQKKYAYARELYAAANPTFYPPPKLKIKDLLSAVKRIFSELPEDFKLAQQKFRKVITLEGRIKELIEYFKKRPEVSFGVLAGGKKAKIEIILTFLAILHLIKEQFIGVQQDQPFGEIRLIAAKTPDADS